jgi:hypothetical protein
MQPPARQKKHQRERPQAQNTVGGRKFQLQAVRVTLMVHFRQRAVEGNARIVDASRNSGNRNLTWPNPQHSIALKWFPVKLYTRYRPCSRSAAIARQKVSFSTSEQSRNTSSA